MKRGALVLLAASGAPAVRLPYMVARAAELRAGPWVGRFGPGARTEVEEVDL